MSHFKIGNIVIVLFFGFNVAYAFLCQPLGTSGTCLMNCCHQTVTTTTAVKKQNDCCCALRQGKNPFVPKATTTLNPFYPKKSVGTIMTAMLSVSEAFFISHLHPTDGQAVTPVALYILKTSFLI